MKTKKNHSMCQYGDGICLDHPPFPKPTPAATHTPTPWKLEPLNPYILGGPHELGICQMIERIDSFISRMEGR